MSRRRNLNTGSSNALDRFLIYRETAINQLHQMQAQEQQEQQQEQEQALAQEQVLETEEVPVLEAVEAVEAVEAFDAFEAAEDTIPCEICNEILPMSQYIDHIQRDHPDNNDLSYIMNNLNIIDEIGRLLNQAIGTNNTNNNTNPTIETIDWRRIYPSVMVNFQDTSNMSYEELSELGDRIGHVTKGYKTEEEKTGRYKQVFCDKVGFCTICQDNFESIKEDIVQIDCSHSFCKPCISEWFNRSKRCPVCSNDPTDVVID